MLNQLVFCCCFLCLITSYGVIATVVLLGNNVTLSFEDYDAKFAPFVNGSGEHGTLFLAEPLDACAPLANNSIKENVNQPFVLIIRGVCSFEEKVRRAQSAGFKAAIVYNHDHSDLIAMAGNPTGITIHAVFVSKESGLKLTKYVGITAMELWIISTFENSAWSVMVVFFILLLTMSAVLGTCCVIRKHCIRRQGASRVRKFRGMSSRLVTAMPSLIFTEVFEDNCTSVTCAICLEDYNVGEKLRILPCRHKFHTICEDFWLTSWRTFCPVCKRDARTTNTEPPASERTPLLSSSVASSTVLSSSNSLGYPSLSPLNSRHLSYASSSYIWSPSQQPHPLRHSESAASFSPNASTHSLPEC